MKQYIRCYPGTSVSYSWFFRVENVTDSVASFRVAECFDFLYQCLEETTPDPPNIPVAAQQVLHKRTEVLIPQRETEI